MQDNNINKPQDFEFEPEVDLNESIGQIIKRARTEKGIRIEKAASETKLKIQYLQAIEKDDFDELPAPIYAKNFIRIYANFLGLNGIEVSKKYDSKNIGISGLTQQKKIALTYYVSSLFHFLFRHPFILLGIAVILIILFFYPVGSDDIEHDELPSFPSAAFQPPSLDDYQPVFDLNEPFPKS
ncbi:helix-turn-helix domain-containing protein [bacterium]|nr:helix-turn-helix domain-containing protein [bacterium]